MNDISPVETLRLIKNRRSIFPKSYTGQKIDREIIEAILEAANWAPTHKLTEPWRFVVFTGKGLKKLGEFQAEYYRKTTPEAQFLEKKFNDLLNKPQLCSHVIAIGMKRSATNNVPEIEEIEAVACAVQNMHLMATAHHLGAYWGSGGVTYVKEANYFFGLDEDDKLLGFFFLGKIKSDFWTNGKRGDIVKKTTWIEED